MARVPVPRSSPVAAAVPVNDLALVQDAADAADLRALSRLIVNPGRRGPRLTDDELNRRFAKMLDKIYEYAHEHDSPIRGVVKDYRDYLTRLVDQDLDDAGE